MTINDDGPTFCESCGEPCPMHKIVAELCQRAGMGEMDQMSTEQARAFCRLAKDFGSPERAFAHILECRKRMDEELADEVAK